MLTKAVLFSGYHVGVNDCLIQDFASQGYTVYMPNSNWGRFYFYAPNFPFAHYPNVKIISWEEFFQLPPMFILAGCVQQANDFRKMWEERGKKDRFIWLTATQDAYSFPEDFCDGILTQDIHYHRKFKGVKMLYLNRPTIQFNGEKDIRRSYESKQINFFINELTTHSRHQMILDDLKQLRDYFPNIKFYGFQSEHGNLTREEVHKKISESMFTGGIKWWETWGQTINESMLLKTPTIHLHKFNINILHDYLLTQDNCVIAETAKELADRINNMTYEEYEQLCYDAYFSANRMCNDEVRRANLNYFLEKLIN